MGLTLGERSFKVTSRRVFLVCLITAIKECTSQRYNPCTSKETCSECIQEDPTCAWCSQKQSPSYSGTVRCNTIENLERERCEDIVNPEYSKDIILDLPLSGKGAKEEKQIQIRPKVIKIDLRPNSTATFSVQYREAEDYPVDLYLLMDLSYTMKKHKDKLASLGSKLRSEMQRITSNYLLGFGSFVDKVVAPYSRIHPLSIDNPCPKRDCIRAYGFINHMPLSSDIKEFVKKVNQSRISANRDTPEGTLDAIMQVIVCEKEIGWRNKSRKLIVIATDEDFHYAGDGKLGGIIKPNDGLCHLDTSGFYTKSGQLDYPSMNQMKRKIKDHNVYLIFAVPEKKVRRYKILNSRLTASTVGKLATDSSNIVTLIREQYEKIVSSIEMTQTVRGVHNVRVSYYSECLDGKWKKRNVCSNIKPGRTVTFDVSMEFLVCPKDPKDWSQIIEIHPVGLSESLTVHLDMICGCNCAQEPREEEENRRMWCSGRGTYECGICQCDDGAYGTSCECEAGGNQTQSDSSGCKYDDDVYECSNRGECQCGKCFCDKRENAEEQYYGKYCQCSNFNCYQTNQKICNGQGTCDCGTCKCNRGWSGPDCSCSDNNDNCALETGAEICSGHGTCECGSCHCDEHYYGNFCDDCQSCLGKCEKYGGCVKCILRSGDQVISPDSCDECIGSTVELVERIEVNETQKEKVCTVNDKDSCKIIFKYKMENYNYITIQVKSTKECPQAVDVLTIAASTAGGVLFVGILTLLLVKIVTELHDKREWAKFQKDLDNANWDAGNNPIFIEPSSNFENPAFGQD